MNGSTLSSGERLILPPASVQEPAGQAPREEEGFTKMATAQVDIKKLLESGAHFGHQTSRWHPRMAPYIHSKRDGSHIIDLTKTVENLERALAFLTETAAAGKQVLLVSTKRQAKDKIREVADATNMPYVTERWLGGMLTNTSTIGSRIKQLKDLESRMISGELGARYSKLEVQRMQEEIDEMNRYYGGIKDMTKPGAVFVADIINDDIAVKEARKLGIPVVAIVDTNGDPSLIDYPIPANDDATKAVSLILDYVRAAIEAGQKKAAKAPADKTEKTEAKPAAKQTADKEEPKAEAKKDEKGGE